MDEKLMAEAVEACHFTMSGVYGDCWNCLAADQCPTWLDTGLERAMVRPDDPCHDVVGVR